MKFKPSKSEHSLTIGVGLRWAKKIFAVVPEDLSNVLEGATVEVISQKPFAAAIIRKKVNGRHVKGIGFAKWNPADAAIGTKYGYNDERGRRIALGRAAKDFIMKLSVAMTTPAPVVETVAEIAATAETVVVPVKRGRGRPKKVDAVKVPAVVIPVKRGRGRPKKMHTETPVVTIKRGRGRPKKIQA